VPGVRAATPPAKSRTSTSRSQSCDRRVVRRPDVPGEPVAEPDPGSRRRRWTRLPACVTRPPWRMCGDGH
jgi:hypothetical protein